MTFRSALLPFLIVASAALPAARASLIGDTIRIDHYFPHAANLYEAHTLQVVAGTSDLVTLLGAYAVNPEANSFHVTFNYPSPWSDTAFNGLVISGIDHEITGVSVATNVAGWDNSRLVFSAHSLSARWGGLNFDESNYFTFTITQQEPVGIPETGSTFAWIGIALGGLLGLGRRLNPAR